MKPAVAPCGHPGTHVTNTFITCNYRCGFGDTRVPILSNPRREPGHVDMCACAPCQIRRRSERLELRDHQGLKVSLTWDGVRNRIDWTPGRSFNARHYSFRDVNGDEVASGVVHVDLVAGRTAHIDIELFMDAVDRVRMSITQPRATCFKKFDPSKVLVTFKGIELKGYAVPSLDVETHRVRPTTIVVQDPKIHEKIAKGCEPVSVGWQYDHDAGAGELVSVSWTPKTFNQIHDDMKAFAAKAYEMTTPDLMLLPGGLFDMLIRTVAEQQAKLYEALERQLFADTPTGRLLAP